MSCDPVCVARITEESDQMHAARQGEGTCLSGLVGDTLELDVITTGLVQRI